ncbi:MAG: 50S ribosomal protein L1 [Sedimentisphaerales bacterium]|nr:50S ribosomal protein L1 [Sedimentisphaerales bacterium]
MRFRSKRYQKDREYAVKEKLSLADAVDKIKGWATTKFNQSVECVVHLGIDSRQADQAIRGAISLPHGIGKTLKVIVFCEEGLVEQAKSAGAVEAGSDELVSRIQGGWLDFDVAIAHPKMMSKVGKLGRILGPQGKMPSPKGGTVTPEVTQAVKEYAAGKVEFRNDSGGNVHVPVGKLDFEPQKLVENITAFLDQIKKMKPVSSKGTYIKKMCISATMSPSVEVILS